MLNVHLINIMKDKTMIIDNDSKKYVAYYRVSTKKQSNSGLGLAAQKETVKQFLKAGESLIAEFTETESGKNDNRIQLQKAIELAKAENALLLIAKLDRISRNASFIFALRDSGVKFVCCDLPDMNTMSIGIFATMAQHERELISDRTKRALAARKAAGFTLGSPQNLTDKARVKSIESRKAAAASDENNKRAISLISSLRELNVSYSKIAAKLNDNNFKTSRGNQFYAASVKQLFDNYNLYQV